MRPRGGVGSRFFTVANGGSAMTTAPAGLARSGNVASGRLVRKADGRPDRTAGRCRVGYAGRAHHRGERIELQLPGGQTYVAKQLVKRSARELPIGSSFDASAGKFYWQPAAGFLGAYDLEFTAGTPLRARPRGRRPANPDGDRHAARRGPCCSASGLTLAGWAVDLASLDGAGIDTLHVVGHPVGGGRRLFVAVAQGGGPRPDVASLYGGRSAARASR